MTDIPAVPPTLSSSIGAQLRAAREAAGLTPEALARQTQLTLRYVVALESDDFQSLPGIAFVRGYLRRYADAVKVPAEPLIAQYDQLLPPSARVHQAPAGGRPAVVVGQTDADPSAPSWQRAGLMVLGLFVVASLVWQCRVPEVPEIEEPLVLPTPEVVPDLPTSTPAPVVTDPALPEAATVVTPATTEAPLTPTTLPPATGTTPTAAPVSAPTAPATSTTTPAATPPVAAPQRPVPAPTPRPAAPAPSAATSGTPTSVAPVAAPARVTPPPAAPAPAAPPLDTLALAFTGTSWISVRDATGQELVYGLKHQGQSVTVSGRPPFAINIGSVQDTRLLHNGREVSLQPYSRGNIASFRLGR